jgi:4,5-DOPA dioxygenase extradiol
MLPSLFISHGSPYLCLTKHEASDFLKQISKSFPKPKYIVIISAHWLTKDLRILAKQSPSKINDFYGFPKELYDLEYKANNNLEKVNEIINLFNRHGMKIEKDEKREGYDHGVWAPLSLMYKDANIPIIQISLPLYYETKKLLKIGEILQNLREEALIIGSGTLTHNLRASQSDINAKVDNSAKIFRDWIVKKIENSDIKSMEEFKTLAPNLVENHPTLDHFLPLIICLGASKSKKGEALNSIYMYGNQAMDTIIFKD